VVLVRGLDPKEQGKACFEDGALEVLGIWLFGGVGVERGH